MFSTAEVSFPASSTIVSRRCLPLSSSLIGAEPIQRTVRDKNLVTSSVTSLSRDLLTSRDADDDAGAINATINYEDNF